MVRGGREEYTAKQKRKARHIEKGYEERGPLETRAARIAWATVNKVDGGGKKSGSGRKRAHRSR
jgi:plasmid stabilization system protein ParE